MRTRVTLVNIADPRDKRRAYLLGPDPAAPVSYVIDMSGQTMPYSEGAYYDPSTGKQYRVEARTAP